MKNCAQKVNTKKPNRFGEIGYYKKRNVRKRNQARGYIMSEYGLQTFCADVRTERGLYFGGNVDCADCTSILGIIAKGTVRMYAETKQSVSAKEKRCSKMLDPLCSIPYLVHAAGVWKGLPKTLKGVRGPVVQCLSWLWFASYPIRPIYKDTLRLPVRPTYLSGAFTPE